MESLTSIQSLMTVTNERPNILIVPLDCLFQQPEHTPAIAPRRHKTACQHPFTVVKPCSQDVLCGRFREQVQNPGNHHFRSIITANLLVYGQMSKMSDKTALVEKILRTIHKQGSRFLRKMNTKDWVEIPDRQAKQKIGHALRDGLARLSSSTTTRWCRQHGKLFALAKQGKNTTKPLRSLRNDEKKYSLGADSATNDSEDEFLDKINESLGPFDDEKVAKV